MLKPQEQNDETGLTWALLPDPFLKHADYPAELCSDAPTI